MINRKMIDTYCQSAVVISTSILLIDFFYILTIGVGEEFFKILVDKVMFGCVIVMILSGLISIINGIFNKE